MFYSASFKSESKLNGKLAEIGLEGTIDAKHFVLFSFLILIIL